MDFIQLILSLWEQIRFSPDQKPSNEIIDETAEDDIITRDGGSFTPSKTSDDKEDVIFWTLP